MNYKLKSDQPQTTVVPRVHLSWMEIWRTYHSKKLWFMLLVHFFPSTTITQGYLLFEGKPSTKHLHGSYGLCFPFRCCWPDPSAGWVCLPVLIIQVRLEFWGIWDSKKHQGKAFLFPPPFLNLCILMFFVWFPDLSDMSAPAYQWILSWFCANQSLWGNLLA